MLNRLFLPILLIVNTACNAETPAPKNSVDDVVVEKTEVATPPPDCAITKNDIHAINNLDGAKQLDQTAGVDSDSQESVLVQTFAFDNADVAVVEQKYCDMYNLSVSYRLAALDKVSFQNGLDNISLIASLVKQDYKIKAPLKLVVDMLMNQQKLGLDRSFDIALPDHSVVSNDSVEHSLAFRLDGSSGAQLDFYFGLGGE